MDTDRLLRASSGVAAFYLLWTAKFAFDHLYASQGWRWIVLLNLLLVSACCLWMTLGRPFADRVRALSAVMPAVAVAGLVVLAQAIFAISGG
ncbi:MAG: hypothetical protein R3A52_13000 [Polyangiales bacterium]